MHNNTVGKQTTIIIITGFAATLSQRYQEFTSYGPNEAVTVFISHWVSKVVKQ